MSSLCTSTFQTPLVLTSFSAVSRPSSEQTAQLAEFLPGPWGLPPPLPAVPSRPPTSTCSGKAECRLCHHWGFFVVSGDQEEKGCVCVFLPGELKSGRDGDSPTGIASLLPDFPVPWHFLSRSLHGQEKPGAPKPIPTGDSSPHLPEGPDTTAESSSAQGPPAKASSGHEPQCPSTSHPGEPGELSQGSPLDPALGLGCECPARAGEAQESQGF